MYELFIAPFADFEFMRRALVGACALAIAGAPLGMFLIPSNNPSGWAITGVGTAFLALLGWYETEGRRRWVLGALYIVGVLMAVITAAVCATRVLAGVHSVRDVTAGAVLGFACGMLFFLR